MAAVQSTTRFGLHGSIARPYGGTFAGKVAQPDATVGAYILSALSTDALAVTGQIEGAVKMSRLVTGSVVIDSAFDTSDLVLSARLYGADYVNDAELN